MSFLSTSKQPVSQRTYRYQELAGNKSFVNKDIRGVDFEGANLTGADFSGAIAGVAPLYTHLLCVTGSGTILLLTLASAAIGGVLPCFPSLFGFAPASPFILNFFSAGISDFLSGRCIDKG